MSKTVIDLCNARQTLKDHDERAKDTLAAGLLLEVAHVRDTDPLGEDALSVA